MKTKCKNCGGNISYSPKDIALVCSHCGTKIEINSSRCGNIKLDYSIAAELVHSASKFSHCKSCGSNLFTGEWNAITRCPNCGSIDIEPQSGSQYKPHAVLPLTITKEKATTLFQNFVNEGSFRPRDFKQMAKLGKLSVFYAPAYNFDAKTNTHYNGVGVTTSNEEGKIVHHYHKFNGNMSNSYSDVLISANAKIGSGILEKLAPWDYRKLCVYSDEFLFGVVGSDINISHTASFEEFKNYVRNSETRKVKNKHNYPRYESLNVNTQIEKPEFNCAYYPVYANYYSYKNKTYACYINGSTGKVYGKSPKSFWKIFGLVVGIIAGVVGTIVAIALAAGT